MKPFRFWLFVLVLFVPLTGWCINPGAFVPRMILVQLMWTALLLMPYVLFQKRSYQSVSLDNREMSFECFVHFYFLEYQFQ